MEQTGYLRSRHGYVVDHLKALRSGGSETPATIHTPANMQWQTIAAAKAKDKTEAKCH